MSKVDKIKEIVKGKFGTDPFDPWSPKAGIAESETAMLKMFLKSRGINPEFVSKDQKIAHSKSGEFLKWKNDHEDISESITQEKTPTQKRAEVLKSAVKTHKEIRTTDGKQLHSEEQIDEISKDLANRYMYSAKSDRAETDAKINKAIEKQGEKWSSRRHKSIGKMIAKGEKRTTGIGRALDRLTKEDIDESYGERADKLLAHSHSLHQQSRKETDPVKKQQLSAMGSKAHKVFLKARDRNIAKDPEAHALKMQSGATQDYKDQEAKRGIGHVRDHVEVEGQVVEARMTAAMKLQNAFKREQEKTAAARKAGNELLGKKPEEKKEPVKEDAFQDSQAATQMPFDTGNNPAEAPTNPKLVAASKSARIIKSLYKKKGVVKEELYDQDKDDKPVQTNGKKPKVSKQVDQFGDDSSKAAIVMAGGKTLTGEPRDTIEIDPMLRKPKGGDVNAPATDGKATDKKENK